jgi:hypothetical protein
LISRREFFKLTALSILSTSILARAQSLILDIKDQYWTRNSFVYIDLLSYVPPGNYEFSINKALPPGVTLKGSTISGIPTTNFYGENYEVTIGETNRPNSPTIISVS